MPWPVSSRTAGFQSLNGATAPAAGKALSVAGSPKLALQVVTTGSPAACIVNLEGTEDGKTWFTLTTWDVTAPHTSGDIVFAVDKPVAQARANLTTLSGGTNPAVSAFIGAV